MPRRRDPLRPRAKRSSPENKLGQHPNSRANLVPCKPGQVLNPEGHNGQRARALFEAFILSASADPNVTRFEQLLMAGYMSGLKPGTRGAQDRRAFYDQLMGKAKEAFTVTGENGGPVRTENTTATLSPEEMAARFVRAARIAQEIASKAKDDHAIPVDAIEVGANAQPEPQIPAGPVTIEPSATPPIGAMRQDALQVVKPAESKTAPPAVGMIATRR